MELSKYLSENDHRTLLKWRNVNADLRPLLVQTLQHLEPNFNEGKLDKIVTHLSYFIARDDKFSGDLNKGIILAGSTGVGKTLLLTAFQKLMRYVHPQLGFKVFKGNQMERMYQNEDKDNLEQALRYACFGFDDIGEEHDYVMVYGSKINIGKEVLDQRHLQFMNKGQLTFGTTNLNEELFRKKYGQRIDSRRHEMFNWIPINGKDHRI